MKTRDVWASYQTVRAYGEHHSADSPFSAAQRAIAGEFLRRRAGARILDIGPGGPVEMRWLRDLGFEPTGFTAHAPEAAAIVRDGFACECGDMEETPFPNASFDAAFSSNVLEHAYAPYKSLMEARRVVREGGFGYFVIPSFEGCEGGVGPFHISCLTVPHWTDLMAKTGWRLDERYDQAADGTIHFYYHFRCTAAEPKDQSAGVFRDLLAAREAG